MVRNDKLKLAGAACLLITAGAFGWTYSQPAADPSLDAGSLARLRDTAYDVECSACGATYEMAADEYTVLVSQREQVGDAGIACKKCGKPKAWRAEKPLIDYRDAWNAAH